MAGLSAKLKQRLRPFLILAGTLAVCGTFVFTVVVLTRGVDTNRQGIETSCLLLVKTIRDSGANSGVPPKTPAGLAQRRLSLAYAKTLLAAMTPADRRAAVADIATIKKAGGSLPEPQCAAAASDPAKVRRDVIQKAQRKANP